MRGRALTGQQLGPFKIDRLIGEGATSEVYAAIDERLARPVALKVLPRHFAKSSEVRRRFAAEARHASQLNHPHVVPIYEADELDGLLYISMLQVEGPDLGRLLEEKGSLSLSRTARLIAQASAALDAAHATGLIHRDVKPQNILIARNERGSDHVFLTDFGLTKAIGSASRHTQTGQIVGTVHYMSPEQIEGREVTQLSDVYSLGCVLYECLSGKTPFERDSDLAVLWAHVNADVPTVSDAARVSHSLDGVIKKALAKDPAERYQSCAELSRAFRSALRRRHLPVPRQRPAVGPYTRRVSPDDLKMREGFGNALKTLAFTTVAVALATTTLLGVARVTGVWGPAQQTFSDEGNRSRLGSPDAQTNDSGNLSARESGGESRGDSNFRSARGDPEDASHSFAAEARYTGAEGFDPESDGLPGSPLSQTVTRTATRDYNAASLDGYGQECVGRNVGCVEFVAQEGEHYVSVAIDDASGRAVRAWVKRDLDGDGAADGEWVGLCRRTEEPIKIRPGAVVRVLLQQGQCGGVESTPTTGTVTAVFSNRGA